MSKSSRHCHNCRSRMTIATGRAGPIWVCLHCSEPVCQTPIQRAIFKLRCRRWSFRRIALAVDVTTVSVQRWYSGKTTPINEQLVVEKLKALIEKTEKESALAR